MNSPFWESQVRAAARVLGISDEKDFYMISGVVENLRVENKSLKAELAEANKKLIEQDPKIMEQLRKASPMFENQNPIKPDNRLLDADGSGNLLPSNRPESNPGQILSNAIQTDDSGGRPNWHLAQNIFDAAMVIVSFGDVDEASEAITEAISKATAELKVENEQLKAQVAALREAIQPYVCAYGVSMTDYNVSFVFPKGLPKGVFKHLGQVYDLTQATADAYEAKVREQCINGFVARILHGDEAHQSWLKAEGEKYLQSLLAAKKDGE